MLYAMTVCKHSICGLTCEIGNMNACCVPLQVRGGVLCTLAKYGVLHLAKFNLVDLSSWVHMSSCLLARMRIGVVSACL